MNVNAETRILMTLLLTAFPEQEETIDEVQTLSLELIRILINYYSTNCTTENKNLTNYVVNSQMSGTVMEKHIKCLESCLEDLDQRRRIQMNVTLKWWQRWRVFILKNQYAISIYMITVIMLLNIITMIMLTPLLSLSIRAAGYVP